MSSPEPNIAQAPPELPPVPRPVTPRVSRRATWDPRVRFWFALAAVMLLAATYLGLDRLTLWSKDRDLVINGVKVDALIHEAAGTDIPNRRQPWDSYLRLRFEVDGKTVTAGGTLREKPKGSEVVVTGTLVPIRYDKDNPLRWTDRTEPPSVVTSLMAVYVLVPVALVSIGVGLLQRARVIGTWKHGELIPAAVLSVSTSPIAPGQAHVNAAPSGQPAIGVFVPRSLANPGRGDLIWLLRARSGPALAARSFL
jgi:hypothetical protein